MKLPNKKKEKEKTTSEVHSFMCNSVFVVKISAELTALLTFHDNRPQSDCSCQLENCRPPRCEHPPGPSGPLQRLEPASVFRGVAHSFALCILNGLRLLILSTYSNTYKAHMTYYSIKYSQPALNKAKKYSTYKIVLYSDRKVH